MTDFDWCFLGEQEAVAVTFRSSPPLSLSHTCTHSPTLAGEVKPSHKTLRHIARVWYMLPKKRAHEDFLEGFSQQASDALLVTYLSSLTKGLTELSQVCALGVFLRCLNGVVVALNLT